MMKYAAIRATQTLIIYVSIFIFPKKRIYDELNTFVYVQKIGFLSAAMFRLMVP